MKGLQAFHRSFRKDAQPGADDEANGRKPRETTTRLMATRLGAAVILEDESVLPCHWFSDEWISPVRRFSGLNFQQRNKERNKVPLEREYDAVQGF